MQFTATLLSLLTATAFAAPSSPRDAKSMAAAGTTTITSLVRACTTDNTSCTWTFGIFPAADAAPTPCTLTATGNPASQALQQGPATCGRFTVTAGWSGQFGPGQGFTTFAVVDNTARVIVYPAYTDAQVAAGAVVTPDQSYPQQALP